MSCVIQSSCWLQGNVLAAAEWLAADCQPYDSLVFFFSGYGGQLIEAGDHDHPYGDTLLPVDHAEVGVRTATHILQTFGK